METLSAQVYGPSELLRIIKGLYRRGITLEEDVLHELLVDLSSHGYERCKGGLGLETNDGTDKKIVYYLYLDPKKIKEAAFVHLDSWEELPIAFRALEARSTGEINYGLPHAAFDTFRTTLEFGIVGLGISVILPLLLSKSIDIPLQSTQYLALVSSVGGGIYGLVRSVGKYLPMRRLKDYLRQKEGENKIDYGASACIHALNLAYKHSE